MHSSASSRTELDEKLLELSAEIDRFEGYRHAHALGIALIADALARRLNLAPHDRIIMQHAALIHDIGELAMNREYISANRALTADERIDLQRHPVVGEQEAARRGFSRGAQLLVRWHQEWWNGAGYPDALEAFQIPLAARIIRVADAFSAMTADRPARAAVSIAAAKEHLIDWAGIEFDPAVVQHFLALDENLYALPERSEDQTVEPSPEEFQP